MMKKPVPEAYLNLNLKLRYIRSIHQVLNLKPASNHQVYTMGSVHAVPLARITSMHTVSVMNVSSRFPPQAPVSCPAAPQGKGKADRIKRYMSYEFMKEESLNTAPATPSPRNSSTRIYHHWVCLCSSFVLLHLRVRARPTRSRRSLLGQGPL
jgi:hypothetical protein